MPAQHPFDRLTPSAVLDMLDAVGVHGDGRLLQLNSYENRVFQVGLDSGGLVVAKFYRPGRWRDEQILEEHRFALELAAAEVPVVAPQPLGDGTQTLGHAAVDGHHFRIAVYPCRSGHGPELDDPAVLRRLGRLVGQIHAVGAQRPFEHRRTLDAPAWGRTAIDRILALDLLPPAQAPAWQAAAEAAHEALARIWQRRPPALLRIHGDGHVGNLLWREQADEAQAVQVVDLDDAVMGPAVQDLWMLLSGEREAMRGQLATLIAGYRQFRAFDTAELALIEPLRTVRMLHHSAWIAERWDDPAFAPAFPWFGTPAYWGQQTTQLREQLEAMAEPPLSLGDDWWH